MASLKLFNKKFSVTDRDLECCTALQDKFINSPKEVIFHLQCAIEAFFNENSLRYLPNPLLYFKDIVLEHVAHVWNSLRWDVESHVTELANLAKSRKGDASWTLPFTEGKNIDNATFIKLLHFSVLRCELTLADYAHAIRSDNQMFIVQCGMHKEQHFSAQPGTVTYLMHRTNPQCLYSICRNGIKSMSKEPGGFMTSGASHGDGIYLSDPGVQVHAGNIILCYAVKNAEARKVRDSHMYVVREDQICLRAIVWDRKVQNNYRHDLNIIHYIQQHRGWK